MAVWELSWGADVLLKTNHRKYLHFQALNHKMAGKKNQTHGTREARIQHIEELMRTFKFVRGKTIKTLAKQWGMPEDSCRKLSAEASKRIAAAVMDPDTVNAKVGAALEEIIRLGMTGDAGVKKRDIIEAAKAWAHISGSSAPNKHEVTGKGGAPVMGPVIFIPPEDNGDGGNGEGTSSAPATS